MSPDPVLFDYPASTRFGRAVPKNRIYSHARARRGMQQRFAAQIDRIVWSHKLSADTLNLRPSAEVAEIQIFAVYLKPGIADADDALLQTIDRAIPSPIVFEVHGERHIETVAAYKRPSQADPTKWVIGDCLRGGKAPTDAARSPLSPALDIAGLYRELIRSLLPLPVRPGEALEAQLERWGRIRVLERDCARLKTQLAREKQFNRKVERNRALREVEERLGALRSQQGGRKSDATKFTIGRYGN